MRARVMLAAAVAGTVAGALWATAPGRREGADALGPGHSRLTTPFKAPFGVAFVPDGSQVFVAGAGLALYAVTAGKSLVQVASWKMRVAKGGAGLAVSPDGKYLAVAVFDAGIALFDVQALKATPSARVARPLAVRSTRPSQGDPDPSKGPGTIDVAFSADGAYLAASDEWQKRVAVFDVAKVVAGQRGLLGHLPAGVNPVGVVALPGSQRIAYTSQREPVAAAGAKAAGAKAAGAKAAAKCTGTVRVADLKTMTVVEQRDAGCSAVRVDVSATGDMAVTARGENAVLLFSGSQVARIPTGPNPVGVRFAAGGKALVVAASNRFGGANGSIDVIDVASRALTASLPAPKFPRNVAVDSTGNLAVVSGYGGAALDVLYLPDVLAASRPAK